MARRSRRPLLPLALFLLPWGLAAGLFLSASALWLRQEGPAPVPPRPTALSGSVSQEIRGDVPPSHNTGRADPPATQRG
jgi:hypothetical protein